MGGRAAIVAAVLALGAAVVTTAGVAGPVDIAGPLHTSLRFQMSPSKLSRAKPTPVRIALFGRYWTDDGSHVPAGREVEMLLDRRFTFALADVPVCSYGIQYDVRPGEIERVCEDAVVGRGSVSLEVVFPEQQPSTVTGALTVYNGGRRPGGVDLIGWTYFSAPVTGGIYVRVKIRKADQGRYGWRARFEVPKIAGGSGSITAYSLRFHKGIVAATCTDGRLQVSASSTFADGSHSASAAIRTCSAVFHRD